MTNNVKRKVINGLISTLLFSVTVFNLGNTYSINAAESVEGVKNFEIINPYKTVDWNSFGQYKAALHMHTNEFDGCQSAKDMIEDCYRKGYDIAAITDHDVTNTTWDRTDRSSTAYLTSERLNEINSGTDRNGRGMIGIPFSTEQSVFDHVNTYWADFLNGSNATIESKIAECEELGGISHINHPGGDASSSNCFDGDQITEYGTRYVKQYVGLFLKYPSCVGLEVFNAGYGNRESFRLLWDHILMNTMPSRQVWGFSNDDAHYTTGIGFNFNVMLLPENSEENIRYAMENGTFYLVASTTNKPVEDYLTGTDNVTFPVIKNIIVDQNENSITIAGENYDTIEWIADSKVIASGESIDLNDYEDKINTYIRAQIKGAGGMTLTQPFGVIEKSSPIKLGDINESGEVNSIDCALLMKHLLGMAGSKLTGEKLIIADVDGNGTVNVIDLAYMKKYILGMIKNFPREQ